MQVSRVCDLRRQDNTVVISLARFFFFEAVTYFIGL